MTCPTCQTGTHPPAAPRPQRSSAATPLVVVRHVRPRCANRCGAPLYAGAVVEQLLTLLDEATRTGVTFQVREFSSVAA